MSIDKIAIGCSRAGSLGNPTRPSENIAVWQAAVDAGIRSFDTANIYAQGDSERLLGKLLRANPGTAIEIVSKAGFRHGKKADFVRLAKPFLRPLMRFKSVGGAAQQARANLDNQNFESGYLGHCLDGSLARLGVDKIPGFLLHDPSGDVLAQRDAWEFLADVKARGLVGLVGVSLRDEQALASVLANGCLDILQLPVSSYEKICGTGFEDEIQARGIRLYLRQVLNRDDGFRPNIADALPPLVENPAVHKVILGISRIQNLNSVLEIIR